MTSLRLLAVLFFQLINARHERASTVLTSNKGFEEWGHVLGDEVMAAALIDRLLHHCHIVNIRGNSYRLRQHQHWLRTASEQQSEGAASEVSPKSVQFSVAKSVQFSVATDTCGSRIRAFQAFTIH